MVAPCTTTDSPGGIHIVGVRGFDEAPVRRRDTPDAVSRVRSGVLVSDFLATVNSDSAISSRLAC
jgi:hypothetical protein